MLEPIGVVTLLVGIATLVLPISVGLTSTVLAASLGAAAALILPGANIQPAHALLGFLGLRLWLDGNLSEVIDQSLRPTRPGFWLLLAVGYGVLTAIFLPRIFAHQVDVFTLNGTAAFSRSLLVPSNGNITQSVYYIGDLICYLFYAFGARTSAGFRRIAIALLCLSISNVIFALLDIITVRTGTTDVLNFIRNAPYVIYVDTGIGDTKRIIGSYTEASAFASATVATFCFTTRLWLGHVFSRAAFATALASFVLIFLSTSSTGYVAIVPCIVALYLGSLSRFGRKTASAHDVCFLFLGPLLACALASYIALDANLSSYVGDIFDKVIATKSSSDSALERGTMNWDALRVFQQTFGLGAGLGSVRTSSFLLACIANIGLVGTALQLVFLGKIYFKSRNETCHETFELKSAAWLACFGALAAAFVSGALIDLGLPFYVFAALAAAVPQAKEARVSDAGAIDCRTLSLQA